MTNRYYSQDDFIQHVIEGLRTQVIAAYNDRLENIEITVMPPEPGSVDVRLRLSFTDTISLQQNHIDYMIDGFMLVNATTANSIVSFFGNQLRDYMTAQWNQRRDQQLQAAQRQRETARDRNRLGRDFEPEPYEIRMGSNGGMARYMPDIRTTNTFYDPTPNGVGTNAWTTVSTSTTSPYISPSVFAEEERSKDTVESAMEARILEKLLMGLELRISMDESDGVVSAEVELVYGDKIITGATDSVHIGNYSD